MGLSLVFDDINLLDFPTKKSSVYCMNTKYMKVALLSLILIPSLSFASIDSSLSYGSKGAEVTELQEYLIANNYFQGQATGNFYSLTLKAVKAFQSDHNLPSTGYVGILTRGVINADLADNLASSTDEAVQETGTSTPNQNPDAMKAAQAQSAVLSAQLQAQLDTQAKLDAINKSIQGIGSPTVSSTPTPTPVTISVNQPVCTSNNSIGPTTINTNWTQVYHVYTTLTGSTTELYQGRQIPVSYTGNAGSISASGYPVLTGWGVAESGTLHYVINAYGNDNDFYNQYKNLTPLATISGDLTLPDCTNFNQ